LVAPLEPAWNEPLEALMASGRAATVRGLAFAVERARSVEALYDLPPRALPAPIDGPRPARDEAVLAAVRGHAEVTGPFTAEELADRLGLEAWEVASAAARLESEGLVLRGRFRGAEQPARMDDEFCDRRLLARIHRHTMDRLRAEIEPVSAQDLQRYLFERHHLGPRARAGGRAGLRDALGMLQGFEAAAAAWERDILAPRVAGYRAEWLDEMCLAGEVVWGRLTPRRSTVTAPAPGSTSRSTSRATPIALAFRRDLDWLLAAVRAELAPEAPTSDAAAATLEALRRRGALFLDDLARAARLPSEDLTSALWDLVGRGLVTGDGFRPLRDLMSSNRGVRHRRGAVQGRWALLEDRPPDEAAAPDDLPDLPDRVAQQLLARYGVVFREIAARESFTVPWRDIARALRLREARGLVRGGRFVASFIGEQYALPEVVDALRRVRRTERAGEVVRIRASDPLNLVGILSPGPRVPSHHAPWLVFVDGALAEDAPSEPVTAASL
jgi:ATP-dependent Lhr-like helicase